MAHALGDVLERAGHHEPAVGEPEQHDGIEILVENLVDDVLDVRAEPDLRACQVHALADAREARREDLMARALQPAPHVPEAVCAGPGPVDENERRHQRLVRRGGGAACNALPARQH